MQETGADRYILFPLGLGVINNHQAGEYQNIRISECVQFHSMNGGVSNRLGWIFSQEMNLPHISTHIHNLIIAQYFCSKLSKIWRNHACKLAAHNSLYLLCACRFVGCWYNHRHNQSNEPRLKAISWFITITLYLLPRLLPRLARAIHQVLTIKYQIKPADRWRENIHTEDPVLQLE